MANKNKSCVEVIFRGGTDLTTVGKIVTQALDKKKVNYSPRNAKGLEESVVINVTDDSQLVQSLTMLFKFTPQVSVRLVESVSAEALARAN